MSTQKNKTELTKHKELALQTVDAYITSLIQSNNIHINGKADKLSYWLEDYIKFLQFEAQFNPSSLKRYKRGDIIQVHLGYNIGSEEGGLHYAVVIEKENSIYSPVITIVPLTSIKPNKDLNNLKKGEVNLGNELYSGLNCKVTHLKTLMQSELDDIRNSQMAINPNMEGGLRLIDELTERLNVVQSEIELIQKIQAEIRKMKAGSIALTNQITTISKIRIYNPKTTRDVLDGIRLSANSMNAIDAEIINRYTK